MLSSVLNIIKYISSYEKSDSFLDLCILIYNLVYLALSVLLLGIIRPGTRFDRSNHPPFRNCGNIQAY